LAGEKTDTQQAKKQQSTQIMATNTGENKNDGMNKICHAGFLYDYQQWKS
jgi:hypothetical protein